MVVISTRTKNKHENPEGWKLDAAGKAQQELFAVSQQSLGERYGVEASDIPLWIHKLLSDNDRRVKAAKLAAEAKLQGQGLAQKVNVGAHVRRAPRQKEAQQKGNGGGGGS